MSKPLISTSIINDIPNFLKLKSEWETLYNDLENPSFSLLWEWITTWLDVFQDNYIEKNGALAVIVLKEVQQGIIGIAPLYVRRKFIVNNVKLDRLGFIATGDDEGLHPENLSFLSSKKNASICNDYISKTIFSDKFISSARWDFFDTSLINPTNPLNKITENYSQYLYKVKTEKLYYSNLSSSFEEYVSTLSKSSRENLNKQIRLFKQGNYTFNTPSSQHEALGMFDELVEMHQKHWRSKNLPGAFSSQKVIYFHKELIKKLYNKNAIFISKLSNSQGKSLAYIYGFIISNINSEPKFEFYQSGVEHNIGNELLTSAGITLHLLSIRYLIEKNVKIYDFLSGESEYKRRFSNHETYLSQINIFRKTFPTGVFMFKKLKEKFLKPKS